MLQTLPVNGFKWVEETSQCNEDCIKSYNKKSHEGSFLKDSWSWCSISEKLHDLHNDSTFLPGRMKIKKAFTELAWQKNVLST